jgi:dipeptidyl-peptidase-4
MTFASRGPSGRRRGAAHVAPALIVSAIALAPLAAQDRLAGMPGYDQFTKMQPVISAAWGPQAPETSGAATDMAWSSDGRTVMYTASGKDRRFDVATKTAVETGEATVGGERGAGRGGARGAGGGGGRGQAPPAGTGRSGGMEPARAGRSGGMEQEQSEMLAGPVNGCPSGAAARGRQADCVVSPDQKLKAFYRNRNLWVANFDGSNERAVTTDGRVATRVKNGTGSWVYGEELGQTTAIWWSPDSTRVGFYRFDEGRVPDFFVQMNQTEVQDSIDIEAYPKAGDPNPIPDVFVFDIASGHVTKIDARDGKPFSNDVGHYVYGVQWTKDGSALVIERANRRQQIVELAACRPVTGACRTVVHEEWTTGWLNASIDPRFSPWLAPHWLNDGRRFIWESERNGWKNYYLYDLDRGLQNPVTSNSFEAGSIVRIDETANVLFYTARDGDNYLKLQLHRVNLNGSGDVRLTDPAFTHTVSPASLSPDGRYLVDVYQTHDEPPASQLLDLSTRQVVSQLGRSDLTKYQAAGFHKAEQFSYLAADGRTKLFGQINFPSNFDPSKKYPVLVSVYGGPVLQSNIPAETFVGPNATAEYGFLMVLVSYRGVPGTGKHAADALYLHLGVTEMDDMAEGVKALWGRDYVDKSRVGIYGTSYGGYASAMELLRHPEVFAVASSSSPTTDWRNYDSTYTERYMWLPAENQAGYDAGNVVTYAKGLRGRLLLYYGSADNNVHQDNTMQLIKELQRQGKSFEVQVGPDQPHSGVNNARMMEFLIENLVMRPASGPR